MPIRPLLVPDASVPRTASFLEAARALADSGLAAIGVVDENGRLLGLFTQDDVLGGLFPGYLAELHHTAFLPEDLEALAGRAETAGSEPVTRHMRKPLSVDVNASPAHVAERFLHCEWGAMAVTEHDRFIGMIGQAEFCRSILSRIAE